MHLLYENLIKVGKYEEVHLVDTVNYREYNIKQKRLYLYLFAILFWGGRDKRCIKKHVDPGPVPHTRFRAAQL